MVQPTINQFLAFASDVACKRPKVRHFLVVSNYLLAIPWRNARDIIHWLDDVNPRFKEELLSVLPRLKPDALVF